MPTRSVAIVGGWSRRYAPQAEIQAYLLDAADALRIEVRREAAEAFDGSLRSALAGTVWHSGCTNWYVDENGNNPNQWPWLWRDYRRRTARLVPGAYQLSR